MKILAVSDVENKYIWEHFDKERFEGVDLIIACGDLKASYLEFLVTLIPATLVYVPGNHDNCFQEKPPEGCICIDNDIFTYKSVTLMGLGGSMRYKPDCPHMYTQKEMTKRARKLRKKIKKANGIDILVTHSPAFQLGDATDLAHTGFKAFLDIMKDFTPKYMLHGHQHQSYNRRQTRFIDYEKTKIINVEPYYLIEIDE